MAISWKLKLSSEPRREGTYARLTAQERALKTRWVYYFLAFIAFIGWWYVLFMSDAFAITTLDVAGVKQIDPIQVKREVFAILDTRKNWRPWNPRHAWFIDSSDFLDQLQNKIQADQVEITNRHYFNVLRLKIQEKELKIIYQSHKQYFWIDLSGLVLKELDANERKDAQARLLGSVDGKNKNSAPLIHQDRDNFITVGFQVASAASVGQWSDITRQIELEGIRYRMFEPPASATTTQADFISLQGEKVIIDMDEPLAPQIRAYRAFKQHQPKEVNITEYIDVRTPKQVYVK